MCTLNRRAFLVGAASSAAAVTSSLSFAASAIPVAASVPRPQLTPSELLMFSTVRLSHLGVNSFQWGTGFLFELFHTATTSVPVIVTDRHVVETWDSCFFSFAGKLANGAPDYDNHIPVDLQNFRGRWISHPEVDLAIIPIADILSGITRSNRGAYLTYLDQGLIPTPAELDELTPVEQVLTVGYPGMLWDNVHSLPVFHRGYTATPPYINFKGREEFLIDIATWPGASGSPVMLYSDSPWINRKGVMAIGFRMKLLGVVYAVAVQDVKGNLVLQNGPTQVTGSTTLQVPANLGACTDASRILEFEPFLVRKGLVKPPPGYVMRAAGT